MSNYARNSLSLFARPDTSQPYQIVNCAMWLVRLGKFENLTNAYNVLIDMQLHAPNKFKLIMSDYHDAVDYKSPDTYQSNKRVNEYRSPQPAYGEDPHMYYAKKF